MENNNLVNLTDGQLDEIAGGYPDWLQTIINILGDEAENAWIKGGSRAVRKYCENTLGTFALQCGLIP